MMWEVPLFKLNYDACEQHAVRQVIESGWLTMGNVTEEFETSFANFLGSDAKCSAVSSGTAALHTALLALDIKTDDEVIIPAVTFVADANVVRMVGAKPVLADSASLEDFNVSPATIEQRITPKTKAVIVVHFAGYPCDMPAIVELCKARGIYLIEDVAHAPGASVEGRKCGAWGDIGCFSFFSNKNLSIGEGGMVSVFDEELYQRVRYFRSHGMTTLTLDRHEGRAISYDVARCGLNYRMDEIRAALGMVQLDKLASGNTHRANLTARYHDKLEGSALKIPFLERPVEQTSAYHIYPVLLPEQVDRSEIVGLLKDKGIQSSIHYPPFWGFTAFQGIFAPADTPIANKICERELTLPLFPTMTDDEIDLVVEAISDTVRKG